jgi:hypothetical protein
MRGEKRATTRPLRSTRYFWKFHSTAPPIGAGCAVRRAYSGWISSPVTWIFENIGNVTP